MELNGRVALVTGGAGGIGGAVVRGLAKAGVSGVAINYRQSAKAAQELAADIERAGVKVIAIQADVQSDEQVRAMIGKLRDNFGRLDIVINNAGVTRWVKLADLEGHFGGPFRYDLVGIAGVGCRSASGKSWRDNLRPGTDIIRGEVVTAELRDRRGRREP